MSSPPGIADGDNSPQPREGQCLGAETADGQCTPSTPVTTPRAKRTMLQPDGQKDKRTPRKRVASAKRHAEMTKEECAHVAPAPGNTNDYMCLTCCKRLNKRNSKRHLLRCADVREDTSAAWFVVQDGNKIRNGTNRDMKFEERHGACQPEKADAPVEGEEWDANARSSVECGRAICNACGRECTYCHPGSDKERLQPHELLGKRRDATADEPATKAGEGLSSDAENYLEADPSGPTFVPETMTLATGNVDELPVLAAVDAFSSSTEEVGISPEPTMYVVNPNNPRPRFALEPEEFDWLVSEFQQLAAPGHAIAIDKWTLMAIEEKGKSSIPPTLRATVTHDNVRSAQRRWKRQNARATREFAGRRK